MSAQRAVKAFSKIFSWWQVIRSYVKWGMTSYRRYGNSDLDKTYLKLWSFSSLAMTIDFLSDSLWWYSSWLKLNGIVTQKSDRATLTTRTNSTRYTSNFSVKVSAGGRWEFNWKVNSMQWKTFSTFESRGLDGVQNTLWAVRFNERSTFCPFFCLAGQNKKHDSQ